MANWIYKAVRKSDGEIIEHTLSMPKDADAKVIFLRIQALRTKLFERGYQFVSAKPMTEVESKLQNVLAWKGRVKNPVKSQTRRRSFWQYSLFGLLLLLLAALVVWWHLYA